MEFKKFESYNVGKKEEKIWIVIGFILFFMTFGISFILFYDFFFEREHFFNRRRLYKRLKCNRIEKIYENDLSIYYNIDDLSLIYFKTGNIVSLQNEHECIMSSVILSPIDRYYYHKIKEIVEVYNDPFLEFMSTFTHMKEENCGCDRFSLYYW